MGLLRYKIAQMDLKCSACMGGFFMYDYECIVRKVWDGDTFDGVVEVGFLMQFRGRFRLFGINAPEMDTEDGVRSHAYLNEKILNKTVVLVLVNPKTIHSEKYGRWLSVIYLDGININKELRDLGYAVGTGGSFE